MDETVKRLMLALTAHTDDLQLFANGIAEDAENELAATEDAVYALIDALYKRYGNLGLRMDYQTVRYFENLKRKIAEIRSAAFDDEKDELEEVSRHVAEEESGFFAEWFAFLAGSAVAAPTRSRLDRIARYGIYNGSTRRQIFDKLSDSDVNRIYDAIADSFQKGRSAGDAALAVQRELMKTRRFVKYEIDAIVNGVANDAALAFAAANRTKLLYTSVLDDRTCGECCSFDGQVFDCDDPGLPSLPRHINCRCRLIPALDGNSAAAPASFAEYIASLSPSEQRSRLGSAKYAAWKSGDYKLKTYETPSPGQRLSAEDLKARYRERFRNAIDLNPHGYMTIVSPVSSEAISSLRRYTCGEDGMYRKINEYMRADGTVPQDKKLEGMITQINSVMRISTLNRDLEVYRGIKSERVLDLLRNGVMNININSFQSTSIASEVSERYAGNESGKSILMKIKLPKGTHCVDVSKISTAPDKEDEILVNPIGKFKITSVYYNEAKGRLEVEAIYEQ